MNDEPRYTVNDLADKIEWEGSLIDVIEWGIKPELIEDDQARLLFREAYSSYKLFSIAADRFMDYLGDAVDE
jgi:hypothetical protein